MHGTENQKKTTGQFNNYCPKLRTCIYSLWLFDPTATLVPNTTWPPVQLEIVHPSLKIKVAATQSWPLPSTYASMPHTCFHSMCSRTGIILKVFWANRSFLLLDSVPFLGCM